MGRKLAGQVAIVTGASSGVGYQTAVRLAEEGVKLCVTARRRGALEKLRSEVAAKGAECLVVPGDVTVDADVSRVVSRCLDQFDRIDLLFNVAGIQAYAPFEELEWEEIVRIFDVTCLGYLRFARAVLPHFRERGSGHIVNGLSMLSIGAAPLLSAYTMSKHALLGWQECLRLELAGSGIDVSGVLIPSVATPMFDHAPTKLGWAPKPVPPSYDPDVAARALVQCAKKPDPQKIPVFLGGRLLAYMQQFTPWIGDFILSHWGDKLQERNERIDRPRGNLFEPMPEGVGPYGSVPPTPRWIRFGMGTALAAGLVGVAGGALLGAREVRQKLRGAA